MASYRSRYGNLVVDFIFHGKRCRETTSLKDTASNRKKLEKLLKKMDLELELGTFNYMAYFPKSKKAKEMVALDNRIKACRTDVPLFKDFVSLWFEEKKIEWRPSYQNKVKIMLNKYFNPRFAEQSVDSINKTDLLGFRSSLGKVKYGKAQKKLSASRINQIMTLTSMILDEAAERYNFESPYKNIRQLKEQKPDINPFSLDEVWLFLENVRADYRNYYLVRFFTGLRTSEIDGLQWECIDFQRRIIRVKQALVNGCSGQVILYKI